MTPIALVLVLTGVLLNACAQLLLKAGTNAVGHIEFTGNGIWTAAPKLMFEPHILGGLACYAISVVVWIGALSRTPVSIAYPMLSIGYIVNALVAWQWFGEALNTQRMLGIGIIIIGVVLITRG